MSQPNPCPQCGHELPGHSPGGLCPVCLLQQGFRAQPPGAVAVTTPLGGQFVPPSLQEIAQWLPNLDVMELIGQGGMGAVYKVRQKSLDRIVALKILPPEVGCDPTFAERFSREAKALARLSHPNVLTIFEFGEAHGLYYLIMEYVDGVNLRQAIHAKSLRPQDSLSIVQQICDALQYAHDEGVVHRDIKPENVLLDKRGRVKIADFGLAKLLGRSPVEVTLTAAHQVMGTLHYMAPEQMEHPLDVDHRADIYSLGVVFYELLTGQLPLGRFPLPSEKANIGKPLDDVVLKTLERDPNRRYQQANAVKTDVQAYEGAQNEGTRHGGASNSVRAAATLQSRLGVNLPGTVNPGVLIMAAAISIAGSALLLLGLGTGNKGYLWAGMGTIIGGGSVAAHAWSHRDKHLGPMALQDFGKVVFGGVLFLVGAVMLLAGYFQTRSEYVWVGFGLMTGAGAIARSGWPADESEDEQNSTRGAVPEKPWPEDQPNPRVRRKIRQPAIALAVAGALHLLALLGTIAISFLILVPQAAPSNTPGDHPVITWNLIAAFVAVGHGLMGMLQVFAAAQMLRIRWRAFAIVVSIASLVPTGPGSLFSVPFGIWALVVLLRDSVRHEFELQVELAARE